MQPGEFLQCLGDALDLCDFNEAAKLVNDLDPTGFDDKQVKKTLGLIRRKRRFADLEKAAGLFVASGMQAPLVRRQWAQALLDQNRIQRYINQSGEQNLKDAIDSYQRGWKARRGDYRWHAVNLVALLERADRDQVAIASDQTAAQIATEVLTEIQDLDAPQVWDYGTAMEASLALGDKDGTLKWARDYLSHPGADAFELGSTLRQLREVWQIDNTEIGQALVPVIEYELLQREGGSVAVSANAVADTAGFEAVYGPESYVHVGWLESMFRLLGSVARVRHCTTGEPFGTGFLIKGAVLSDGWGDAPVFVTNAHVVSDCAKDKAALRPEDACAEFTRLPGQPKIPLGAKRFHSKRVELDAWICGIQAPEGGAPLELSFYPPLLVEEGDRPQRVFVIGHPKGGELVVSLYNNDLVGYEGPYVHYNSPTEGGSSGSPVLSRDLKAFALHHRTREALQVNEGVVFEQIKQKAAETL